MLENVVMLNASAHHRQLFQARVIHHIRQELSPEEWIWLREHGDSQVSGLMPPLLNDPNATPEELVGLHVREEQLNVSELLEIAEGRPVDVIAGQPLYYCRKPGIYAWGMIEGESSALTFSIPCPGMPAGAMI